MLEIAQSVTLLEGASELPNVLDSIFLPLKRKVKANVDDLDENWQTNVEIVHTLAMIGVSRFDRLFPVTFRGFYAYVRTDVHTLRQRNTVPTPSEREYKS